jgi:large subunit ribosomal protein L29
MSNKSIKELRNLTKDELLSRERTITHDLFQNRMKKVTGQLEKQHVLWKARKDIARIKGLLAEKSTKAN